MLKQIYFDCNATTPTLADAQEAALQAMQSLFGNPSSSHMAGLQARHILESTRKKAAQIIGSLPDEIIFTSGATEAIQTAVFSSLVHARDRGAPAGSTLLYGATEHKAVPQAMEHWVRALGLPYAVKAIPVDQDGQLDQAWLKKELPGAILVATMAVNNETGVIQDLGALHRVMSAYPSVFWLVDCVQGLGKLNLDFNRLRVDYAPFSGHKLYAPKGIGFLYCRKGAPISPLIVGGGQERGLRSGTENLPGVAALGAMLEHLIRQDGAFATHATQAQYRDQLVATLKKAFPKIQFNTPFKSSVPTTINFSIPGFSNKELLDLFDSAGVRVSGGSACSSSAVTPSHVLVAMHLPEERAASSVRLSFGPATTREEIEDGCEAIAQAAIALQGSCLLPGHGEFEAPEELRDGIVQFRAGPTNTWVLANKASKQCVIIDPSESVSERIEQFVRCQSLSIAAILDTHSHADHDSVRPTLSKVLGDCFVGARAETDSLGWPRASAIPVKLADGTDAEAIQLGKGGDVLVRVPTPGHTRDSHALLVGQLDKDNRVDASQVRFAFCGDTILSGGLGRTNFAVSDVNLLFDSLRKIQKWIHARTLLCPAHDYTQSFATSLETETQANPLLSAALGPQSDVAKQDFVRKKEALDQELARIEAGFQGIVCGVTQAAAEKADAACTLPIDRLGERVARGALLIDVREPAEFRLFKDWQDLSLSKPPRNVPLSRIVNYMSELLASSQGEIILVCRTGNRSLQAAKALKRMGIQNVLSLEGGIAATNRANATVK